MINYHRCCDENNITIRSIDFVFDLIFVKSIDNNIYVLKDNNKDLRFIFEYLKGINFNGFELPINIGNDYELYQFHNEFPFDSYEKAKEFINLLVDLHTKSFSYIDYITEKKEKLYNFYSNEIDNRFSFYLNLQDSIEEMEFIYPAYYLLLNNISNFYKLLKFARMYLDKWYKSENLHYREVMLIGNARLNNFCCGDKKYFISWDDANKDLIIFDFNNFYRSNYDEIDIYSLFEYYNSKIKFSNDEMNLFFSIISIIDVADFSASNFENTLKIRKLISYVEKTLIFVSEEYKKNQKTNE